MTSKKPHLEVAIALIERDGRVLIARRHPDVHVGDCWEFPGGKRHAGESYEACIVREIKEELGVEAEVTGPWLRIDYEYAEHTLTMRGFRCRIVRGTPQALAAQEVQWVAIDDLRPQDFPPANQESVRRLKADKAQQAAKE